jgi:hypothetical protein
MRQLSSRVLATGERFKAAVIFLSEFRLAHWSSRLTTVDRSQQFRQVYETVLAKTRQKPVDSSIVVTVFRNSVATEWESIKASYPPDLCAQLRHRVIHETGVDPHAMYLESQKAVLKIVSSACIRTDRQFHAVKEFVETLDSDDINLKSKCTAMLDEYEALRLEANR